MHAYTHAWVVQHSNSFEYTYTGISIDLRIGKDLADIDNNNNNGWLLYSAYLQRYGFTVWTRPNFV